MGLNIVYCIFCPAAYYSSVLIPSWPSSHISWAITLRTCYWSKTHEMCLWFKQKCNLCICVFLNHLEAAQQAVKYYVLYFNFPSSVTLSGSTVHSHFAVNVTKLICSDTLHADLKFILSPFTLRLDALACTENNAITQGARWYKTWREASD